MDDLSYIDVLDLLESTGIRNISQSGGEVNFSCPLPTHLNGDSRPSARMNIRTTAWICHGCGARGNAITFLALYKELPETVAKRLLEERYGGQTTAAIGTLTEEVERIMDGKQEEERPRVPPHESWIGAFYCPWRMWDAMRPAPLPGEYMLERGFRAQDLERWQIGYDEVSDRITIPIRDRDGTLVGFKGRDWTGTRQPKYLILGDNERRAPRYGFETYRKSEYVFGLDRFVALDSAQEMIIVEGELNTIVMHSYGYTNTVGVAGSEFSETQRRLVCSVARSAVTFFDDDQAGQKGTWKVIDALVPFMPVRAVLGAPGDAAELDKGTIINLIDSARSSLELSVAHP